MSAECEGGCVMDVFFVVKVNEMRLLIFRVRCVLDFNFSFNNLVTGSIVAKAKQCLNSNKINRVRMRLGS